MIGIMYLNANTRDVRQNQFEAGDESVLVAGVVVFCESTSKHVFVRMAC